MNEDLFQHCLDEVFDSRILEAMRYSLLAGGKRIRPTLLSYVLRGYQVDEQVGKYMMAAIEMIHTYSLIHDDLPAMDNDDLRRGRLTNHKQFDEATAILAGDGLLTYAFSYALKTPLDSTIVCQCLEILATMAGPSGMIYGQYLDMYQQVNNFDDLSKTHYYKTGCLLQAPLMIGCLLANHPEDLDRWKRVGAKLGLAFQLQDDLLDVIADEKQLGKSQSDQRNDKITSITLLGVTKTKEHIAQLFNEIEQEVQSLNGFQTQAILELIHKIQQRTY